MGTPSIYRYPLSPEEGVSGSEVGHRGVACHPTWALGTEPESSRRTSGTHNH